MKRILGLGILLMLSSLPLLAARNSQTFVLPTDVRIGDVQLPQGPCKVTWTEASGSQVQLTIKTQNKKTITIPARLVEVNLSEAGVTTFVDNGVTYLQDFHTAKETFILPGTPSTPK
jgi:phenolic acid decarboxylase